MAYQAAQKKNFCVFSSSFFEAGKRNRRTKERVTIFFRDDSRKHEINVRSGRPCQDTDRHVTRKLKIHIRYIEHGARVVPRDRYRRVEGRALRKVRSGTARGTRSPEGFEGPRLPRRGRRRRRRRPHPCPRGHEHKPFASQSTQYLLSSSRSICVSRF